MAVDQTMNHEVTKNTKIHRSPVEYADHGSMAHSSTSSLVRFVAGPTSGAAHRQSGAPFVVLRALRAFVVPGPVAVATMHAAVSGPGRPLCEEGS
jgi:hypothetical protein